MLAERGRVFVNGEARSVRGDLEQHAAGLEKVDRLEPESVDYFSRPAMSARDFLTHQELCVIVGHAPRNMMHPADPPATTGRVGNLTQLHVAPRSTTGNGESRPVTFVADVDEAEDTGEERSSLRKVGLPQTDSMQSTDLSLRRD